MLSPRAAAAAAACCSSKACFNMDVAGSPGCKPSAAAIGSNDGLVDTPEIGGD